MGLNCGKDGVGTGNVAGRDAVSEVSDEVAGQLASNGIEERSKGEKEEGCKVGMKFGLQGGEVHVELFKGARALAGVRSILISVGG